jgi:hypothetical protein
MPTDFLYQQTKHIFPRITWLRLCRACPHIRRSGNTRRMTTLFSNIGICPIVFNVWEGLKKEFGDRVAGVDEYDWV